MGSSQSMLGLDTMSGMVQENAMPARMPVPMAEAPIMPATEANSASTDLKKLRVRQAVHNPNETFRYSPENELFVKQNLL